MKGFEISKRILLFYFGCVGEFEEFVVIVFFVLFIEFVFVKEVFFVEGVFVMKFFFKEFLCVRDFCVGGFEIFEECV